MKFGQKIRSLRRERQMGQRALAEAVGVSFTYISKIENHRLDFGDYPSDELIVKLAKALDADPDELLVLAQKVPEPIRQRVLERPEAFRKLAALDDKTLDLVLAEVEHLGSGGGGRTRRPGGRHRQSSGPRHQDRPDERRGKT